MGGEQANKADLIGDVMGSTPHPVLFFLGAGASVMAGVPATEEMVDRFLESLKANQLADRTLKEIVSRLRHWSKESEKRPITDIELLLQVLERLQRPYEDPLTLFFSKAKYDLEEAFPKANLVRSLRTFMKSICLVGSGRGNYLQPLLQFLLDHGPIRVFTVNYDTVVEQFCNDFRLELSDGFDLEWNPIAFDRDNLDLQLFKLHGSITWYETDQGKYIKLPVFIDRDEVQLFTKEIARSLMIYPAQKSPENEPLLHILLKLRESLEQSDLAVVAGYSFRDPHIVQMFWEAGRRNHRLLILFVSPSAFHTYAERLENYPTGSPSSIKGRVVSLPFLWEKVLPQLKSTFISNLRLARGHEETVRAQETRGEKVDWSPVAIAWARGGNYFGAEWTYSRAGFPNAAERAEVAHYLWMMAKLGEMETTRKWGKELMMALDGISPAWLTINQIEAKLRYSMSLEGKLEFKWSLDDGLAVVKTLLQSETSWDQMVPEKKKPLLSGSIQALERIEEHLETWHDSPTVDEVEALAINELKDLLAELQELVKARVLATVVENADWTGMEREIYNLVVRIERGIYESLWETLRTVLV